MMIKANRVYTHLKQIYDDIDALGWKSWVDRCLRNHLQLKLNDQFNRWIVPTATIGFAFLWDRAHQMKRNESQYKANNISGSQVGGEGNDGLVNTSTLAWTYTGDVEEKGEQEDCVKRQFLKEIKNFDD
jgi:hypothetical protein